MALTADRKTPVRTGRDLSLGVAASAVIHAGALMVRNAGGFAAPGSVATTLKALGRAEESVDNSAGANGALSVRIQTGTFRWKNSAAADEITAADIGNQCYVVDDETVAKTDGTATRSVAGRIVDVDADGVWVEMGPAVA